MSALWIVPAAALVSTATAAAFALRRLRAELPSGQMDEVTAALGQMAADTERISAGVAHIGEQRPDPARWAARLLRRRLTGMLWRRTARRLSRRRPSAAAPPGPAESGRTLPS